MSMSAWIAVRDYSMQRGTRLVLMWMIADNIMDETNSCFCSQSTLANRSRIHRSEVQVYIPRLIADGELIRTKRPGHSDIYAIPILEFEPGYAPEKCEGQAHECNGYHTPLSIVRADIVPQRRRPKRKDSDIREIGLTSIPGTSADQSARHAQHTGQEVPGILVMGGLADWSPDAQHTGQEHLSNTYINTRFNTYGAHARTRDTNLAENLETAETEPETSSPPAPLPLAAPIGPEQRALWREVRGYLVAKGMPATQIKHMDSCHLYPLGQGTWRLIVPRGQEVGMFRSRYGDVITDALCSARRAGNQVVEFAS